MTMDKLARKSNNIGTRFRVSSLLHHLPFARSSPPILLFISSVPPKKRRLTSDKAGTASWRRLRDDGTDRRV